MNHARPAPSVEPVAALAGCLAVLAGGVVLTGGWALDMHALRSVLPGLASMKPNTALGLGLDGAGLWLLRHMPAPGTRRGMAGRVAAAAAALIGALTLLEYLTGWSVGIDELLFTDGVSAAHGMPPGRPAPNTATGILLIALALLLLDRPAGDGRWQPAEAFALAAGLVAFLGLVGYAYDVRALYAVTSYSSMAVHTAVVLAALAVGVVCARPRRGLMAIVTADTAGGYLSRRLLPAAFVLPPLMGWLRLAGEDAGLYHREFGLALFVSLYALVFAGLIVWSALSLHVLDLRRRQVEHELQLANEGLEARAQERTEALRAEIAEREATEERFRALFELAPDAVIFTDRGGGIVLINEQAEALFGYSRRELVGQPIEILVPDAARPRHQAHRDGYLGAPRVRPMGMGLELHGRRKDGTEVPIEVSLSPLETDSGTFVTSIIRDVTLRKQSQDSLRHYANQLEVANRELESFSYAVSHDLRAPLRSIDGFSRILLDDYGEQLDDTGRDRLTRVRRASQRMAGLIDDLLKLSQVTRAELDRQAVDLSRLAGEVAETLAGRDPQRTVRVDIEPGLRARADPHLLRVALENLLDNAWKFTAVRREARIEIGRDATSDVPVYFVRDNGAGFDMTYVHKLFTAFQRLHDVSEFPGTGIGLATVQRVMRKHGGRIWAEGEVDHGATFYFTLEEDVPA